MSQERLNTISLSKTSPSTTKGAVEALESVSIHTSTPDEAQPLTRAYINAMRKEVMGIDGGSNEELGNKLDEIRERAEGISGALTEVRV